MEVAYKNLFLASNHPNYWEETPLKTGCPRTAPERGSRTFHSSSWCQALVETGDRAPGLIPSAQSYVTDPPRHRGAATPSGTQGQGHALRFWCYLLYYMIKSKSK